jgi:hypothetical protein
LISACESRGHNAAIGQRYLNFFIAAKGVFRRNNDSVAPDDAAGRTTRLGVNGGHGRRDAFGHLGQRIRKFNEFC